MSLGKLGYYNPDKPMESRITDIGPPHYYVMFPPVIKKNYGKWLYLSLIHISEPTRPY